MNKFIFMLTVVFLLSFLIRFPLFHSFIPSLNWDEVSLGYNAYSVLKTGRDEWGIAFPTLFRAFGDYKLPIYVYSDVLPIFMFGLNETSVRIPSILAGVLLVAVGYVLGRSLSFSRHTCLWLAVILGFSPWTWFLSQVAVEANLAVLFITLGITLLLRRNTELGFLFLGLSVWTYNSARVFVPLFLLYYFLSHRKQIKFSPLSIAIAALFLVPMLLQLLSPVGQARYKWLSLIDAGTVGAIDQKRNSSGLPELVKRVVYNRPLYASLKFTTNYLSHFSPDFLFFRGGTHYQFSLPNHGLMYLLTLPLFYLGVFIAVIKFRSRDQKLNLLLVWLLLAALPGSLVKDAPHPLRTLIFSIPAMALTSYALNIFLTQIKHKAVYIIFCLGLLISFLNYLLLQPGYSKNYSWSWQYGYKEAVELARTHYSEYDEIVVTKRYGEPHEFFLFYWPWRPNNFRNDQFLIRYFRSDWFWVDAFDKFKFINDWAMKDYVNSLNPNKKYLIIASPENPGRATNLSTITFLDGQPAFLIQEK